MGRVKNWWIKINTPFYKRSLDSLIGDEKKDKKVNNTLFFLFVLMEIMILLTFFLYSDLVSYAVKLSDVSADIKIAYILILFVAGFVVMTFLASYIALSALTGELNNNLKNMATQLKLMEKNQKQINQIITFDKDIDLDGSLKKNGAD